jgi:hypothetical protein
VNIQILYDPPTPSMKSLLEVTIFNKDMRQLSRAKSCEEYSAAVEAFTICEAADAIPPM